MCTGIRTVFEHKIVQLPLNLHLILTYSNFFPNRILWTWHNSSFGICFSRQASRLLNILMAVSENKISSQHYTTKVYYYFVLLQIRLVTIKC